MKDFSKRDRDRDRDRETINAYGFLKFQLDKHFKEKLNKYCIVTRLGHKGIMFFLDP